jgi:NAD(P)-dependent dehydrogenase (short-subunit alcohol dehydrogenase family)
MNGRLENKTAVITGSSRGIGAAIARGFAEQGCNIVINYFSSADKAAELKQQIEDLGVDAISIRADVSKRDEVNKLFDVSVKKFGKIDILVNNAGIIKRTPFLEINDSEWDEIFGIIVKGYFICGQIFGKHMVDNNYGKIINISSISKYLPDYARAHYCAAKGAIGMLTKSMAYELSPHGVNVNEIVPGAIKTDIDIAFKDEEILKKIEARTFMKGVGDATDLVGAAIFLASNESEYITGSEIVVDGGYLLYKRDKIK